MYTSVCNEACHNYLKPLIGRQMNYNEWQVRSIINVHQKDNVPFNKDGENLEQHLLLSQGAGSLRR